MWIVTHWNYCWRKHFDPFVLVRYLNLDLES
jgi:hypothetical protein